MDAVLAIPVGIAVSLFLEFFPKVAAWFHGSSTRKRKAVVGIATVLVGILIGLGTCQLGLDFGIEVSCGSSVAQTLINIVRATGGVFVGTQAAHPMFKRS